MGTTDKGSDITKTCPCNIQRFFQQKNFDSFNIFAQNIELAKAVLSRTHNLCFGPKIRKTGIPLQTPVLLYKSGVKGDIHFMEQLIMDQNNP